MQCGSICRSSLHLASPEPPSYTDSSCDVHQTTILPKTLSQALQPGVVWLGVNTRWHIPLLTCRALSTAPAAWWGLRCALTFLGELLLGPGADLNGGEWDVEKRFRVTEVFLAILWVLSPYMSGRQIRLADRSGTGSVLRRRIYPFSLLIVSCLDGMNFRLPPAF